MRTSLNNIKAIDDYLLGVMAPDEALLFDAKKILNSSLATDIQHQQRVYAIVRTYGRQNLKAEIKAVQETLATKPQHSGYMNRIINLFKAH